MSLAWSIIEAITDLVAPEFLNRRRVRVAVHVGNFFGDIVPSGREEMYFTHAVKKDDAKQVFFDVTNLSGKREIEVTHVWLATSPTVSALPEQRPLPKRLKPDESWGSWVCLDDVPPNSRNDVWKFARVRLSTGRTIKAVENKDVPPEGYFPGKNHTRS